ncbi:MAG: hypothetical protein CLLPBCKN_008220 [Chroococcidiopsis cubana SAG 39.79]|nr:hypothetical protein [Chroococcidiopsis cubana SAG 39.79]
MTTRKGLGASIWRIVKRGLSILTVFPPTMMASHAILSCCTSSRAAGLVIQAL